MRNGQRFWLTNTRYRQRPVIVVGQDSKYVHVEIPTNKKLVTKRVYPASLTPMLPSDFGKWSTKWDELFEGKYDFSEQ